MSASVSDKKIVITQQIKLNEMLWRKVDKLEFMLQQQMEKKNRDERRFVKKLVRLAKYLELKGMNSQEIATILRQNREQNHAFDMAHKARIFGGVDNLLRKGSQQGLDLIGQPRSGQILGKKTYQSEIEEINEADLQIQQKRIEKNKKKKLKQLAKLQNQEIQQDPNQQTQQLINTQLVQGEDTESDSDFENMKMTARGERQYLEDFLTLGELGGKIPPSLLINVNFEKFAQENGFDLIDFEGNINNEKK